MAAALGRGLEAHRVEGSTSPLRRRSAGEKLADLMNPHIEELCRRWNGIPVTRPASVMNTRSAPGR